MTSNVRNGLTFGKICKKVILSYKLKTRLGLQSTINEMHIIINYFTIIMCHVDKLAQFWCPCPLNRGVS